MSANNGITGAIRKALSQRSAIRRDELLTALPFDVDEMDESINVMIRRGEVETLRPVFSQPIGPCFYRLVRETDGHHLFQPGHRTFALHNYIDALEMGVL